MKKKSVILFLIVLFSFSFVSAGWYDDALDFFGFEREEVEINENEILLNPLLNDAFLEAYWNFDGNVLDSTGNGHDGTNYGAEFVDGLFGNALSFDGLNDFVNVSHSSELTLSELSVSVWIKPTEDLDSGKFWPIIRKDGNDVNLQGYGFNLIYYGGYLYGYFGTDTQATWDCTVGNIANPIDLAGDQWYHVVMTKDSSGVALYLNGKSFGSFSARFSGACQQPISYYGALSGTSNYQWFNNPLIIGHSSGSVLGSRVANGLIEDVALYGRGLTSEEVEVIYNEAFLDEDIDRDRDVDLDDLGLVGGMYGSDLSLSDTDCYDASLNPIPICTCDDLNRVREILSANYELQNNIDFASCGASYTSGLGWEPIGILTIGSRFTGNFDGNDYIIKGLYIDRRVDYVGLFGYVDGGSIKDVGLVDVDISGKIGVGGLVGKFAGIGIENCFVSGIVNGERNVGGLVGESTSGELINSYSMADVSGSFYSLGGLVGVSAFQIRNSYATGDVTGLATSDAIGGLVGVQGGRIIERSYATGDVRGDEMLGGFIGATSSNSVIRDSYATGDVNGKKILGGFAGRTLGSAGISNSYATGNVVGRAGFDAVGGFAGGGYNPMEDSFSVGGVSGTTWSAGLIGRIYSSSTTLNKMYWNSHAGNPEDCYWDSFTTTGNNNCFKIDDDETYFYDVDNEPMLSWDFEDVWSRQNDGVDFPVLKWEEDFKGPWNGRVDVNKDSFVDLYDLTMVAKKQGIVY